MQQLALEQAKEKLFNVVTITMRRLRTIKEIKANFEMVEKMEKEGNRLTTFVCCHCWQVFFFLPQILILNHFEVFKMLQILFFLLRSRFVFFNLCANHILHASLLGFNLQEMHCYMQLLNRETNTEQNKNKIKSSALSFCVRRV